MKQTGISQAFFDFVRASEVENSETKQVLKFCSTCKETTFGIFMDIKWWYNYMNAPVFGTIMSYTVKKKRDPPFPKFPTCSQDMANGCIQAQDWKHTRFHSWDINIHVTFFPPHCFLALY